MNKLKKIIDILKKLKYNENNKIKRYNYDLIFVTDLCLHEPILTTINEDEVLRNKVLVLDHHKTEIANAKYDFVNVVFLCCSFLGLGIRIFSINVNHSEIVSELKNEILKVLFPSMRFLKWAWYY